MENIQYYEHLCACGCGGQIEIRKSHKKEGIPIYIHNHHLKGKKRGKQSKEHIEKLSKSRKGRKAWNKGIPMEEETKKKIRDMKTGKKLTEEHRQNLSIAKRGKQREPFTKEHRQKISDSHKGKFSGENNPMYGIRRFGELSPNWNNGSSFEEYPQEFNKELKQSILERDNYTCQDPNCEHKTNILDAHHIDYNKKNNNSDNIITLCRSCHAKTNGKNKRKFFMKFYQNIMETK